MGLSWLGLLRLESSLVSNKVTSLICAFVLLHEDPFPHACPMYWDNHISSLICECWQSSMCRLTKHAVGIKAWERDEGRELEWGNGGLQKAVMGARHPWGHGDLLGWVASTVDQVFMRSSSHWLWVVPWKKITLNEADVISGRWSLTEGCAAAALSTGEPMSPSLEEDLGCVSPCLFHKFPGSSMCNSKQTNKQKTLETT